MNEQPGRRKPIATSSSAAGKGKFPLTTMIVLAASFWTTLIVALTGWDYREIYTATLENVRTGARDSFNKDLLYRRWVAVHGGVYVPITPETPPNPYLAHIPERDISTPSGKKLTLMNPAYMTRQVHELAEQQYGTRGHITSLRPIRTENAPDEWEKGALAAFERGEKEVSSLNQLGNETYLRFMRPMIVEPDCLSCHGDQGYKSGDIRGGISISVPWGPFRETLLGQLRSDILGHVGIWVIGILGLWFGRNLLEHYLFESKRVECALRESAEFTRSVIESSNDCIKVLDLEGHILSMNEAGQKLLEIDDLTPYLNKSWVDFWKGKDREAALEAISKAKQGDTETFRGYCETAKGTPKWWEITVSPIKDPQGNCDRLLAVSRDITERKRLEEVQTFLAQTSSGVQDEPFFETLARYLAESLGMDFVCIDRLEGDKLTARMVAVWCDGHFKDNVTYALKDTPCSHVVGKMICCFPTGVRQLFPRDQALQDLRAESYVGATLFDHTGQPIGLIAVIGRSPLVNRPLVEAMLKMVAVRTAGEMERLDAAKALRENGERYRSIIQTTTDGFWMIDAEGKITDVNETYCRTSGYTRAELLKLRISDLDAIDEPAEIAVRIGRVIANGSEILETRHRRKDGSVFDVEVSTTYLNADGGKFICFCRDITERKRMENNLRGAHKDLEEKVQERTRELKEINEILAAEINERKKSEQRYRIVADNTYDWEFWLSPHQDVIYTSSSCERITGYLPHEFQQDPNLFLQITHPDDLQRFEKHYHEEYKNDFSSSREIEYRIIHKNGSVRWIGHLCGPAFSDDGAYVGIRGSNRDITEQKKSAEENLLLERQLRQAQKMEAIGTLAGGIAHDFNNILGAISGFTELTLQRVPADSKEKRYLKRIFTATRRAVNLVSQILAFSRHTEKELQPLRLSPIIKEVLMLVRATTPTTIDIRQNITAEPDLVMADATYIHQVFMNLCVNANHAMQKNGGVLSVGLINESIVSGDMNHPGVNPGPYLKLTVSDTGEGIEPGIIDKIFDPFFTTKKQGEGSGLGLAVVYGIVKSLGGEIKVDSRLGRGTSFEVWLPMLADSLLEDFSEGEDTISIRGSGRILFVDDEEALVEMATDMLESLGYEVTATNGSVEALEIFRADPDRFDLVITDQTMPKMPGMALAQEIMRIRPDTPIILCTGFSSTVNAGEAKNAGIRDFVVKPLIKNKIADSIHHMLKKTRSQK